MLEFALTLLHADRGNVQLADPATRGREMTVATFVLIHGGGDVGWYWHLVERTVP